MFKRILIFSVALLSVLAVSALAPTNNYAAPPMQETVVLTVPVPTIVIGPTSTIPDTGGTGTPLSTMIIFGLLALLGLGIIVGGIAMTRRQQ